MAKKAPPSALCMNAFDLVAERGKSDPVEMFEQALRNAAPRVKVRPRRVGGSTYQVPMEVDGHRQATLAMRWLIDAASKRSGRSMAERLAGEVLDAVKGAARQ